jgi:hypothetical protein
MPSRRPPDPTMIFYQLDGIPLCCGDGSLSSRLRYLAALLERVGNDQSREVIAGIQRDVDRLQAGMAASGAPPIEDPVIRARFHQVYMNLSEAFAQADRYRNLALVMARQLRRAGLTPPDGCSTLILDGCESPEDGGG